MPAMLAPACDRRFLLPSEVLCGEIDAMRPNREKAAKFFIRNNAFYLNHEKAFKLPGIMELPECEGIMKESKPMQRRWLRPIIEEIISTKSGGWKYLYKKGAVVPHSDNYAKSNEGNEDLPYWIEQLSGPEKGALCERDFTACYLRRLWPEYYNSLEKQTKEQKLLDGIFCLNEALRKNQDAMTPKEKSVFEKAEKGEKLEQVFLFYSGSKEAKCLFAKVAPLGSPTLQGLNGEIKRIARECGISRPGSMDSRMLKSLLANDRKISRRWFNIESKGGKLSLIRKPFFEFDVPSTNESAIVGADGERYLARRKNGKIAIFFDEQAVLDGIYKHPLNWADADIDQHGNKSMLTHFTSRFELACFAFPEKMRGKKEWEMASTPRNFFKSRLLFSPGKKTYGEEHSKWLKKIRGNALMRMQQLGINRHMHVQDMAGDCYIVKKLPGGFEVHTDRRNKITEAVEWLADKYQINISSLRRRHFVDQDLENLLDIAGSYAVLLKMARPGISVAQMGGGIYLSDDTINSRLLKLWPGWEQWRPLWKEEQGKSAMGFFEKELLQLPPGLNISVAVDHRKQQSEKENTTGWQNFPAAQDIIPDLTVRIYEKLGHGYFIFKGKRKEFVFSTKAGENFSSLEMVMVEIKGTLGGAI